MELIGLYTVTSTYAIMNYIFYIGNSVFTVQKVLSLTFFSFFSKLHLTEPDILLRSGIMCCISKTLCEVKAVCFPNRSKPNIT